MTDWVTLRMAGCVVLSDDCDCGVCGDCDANGSVCGASGSVCGACDGACGVCGVLVLP